jgi:hypothetical protein
MEQSNRGTIQAMIMAILKDVTPEDRKNIRMMELLYRRLGWFVANAMFIEPKLRELYSEVEIPSDIGLDRDPLWVVVRPDRILKDRQTNKLVYRLFKPTTNSNYHWKDIQKFDINIHVGMMAAAEHLVQEVPTGQVVGLCQGFTSATDGKLRHPYVYVRFNRYTHMWSNSATDTKGDDWEDKQVWENPSGIVGWVTFCGEGVAYSQFPVTTPISVNTNLVDGWANRRLHRERELHAVAPQSHTNRFLREIHFGRNTKECKTELGVACDYLGACWGATAPLMGGLYCPNPDNIPASEA